jgi:hypothetical protein
LAGAAAAEVICQIAEYFWALAAALNPLPESLSLHNGLVRGIYGSGRWKWQEIYRRSMI